MFAVGRNANSAASTPAAQSAKENNSPLKRLVYSDKTKCTVNKKNM